MAVFQAAAVANVTSHTGPVLEEQGIRDFPVGVVNPAALVGVASDGRPLGSLVTLPGLTDEAFERIVKTQLADVARSAAALERAVRPNVTHYVRTVNLPACGRCIILAGIPQRTDVAFKRHPRCDCGSQPATSGTVERFATDPRAAFESMSRAEQDKAFTVAGAEAVRLGADPSQVVNARRGMDTAQDASGRRRLDRSGPVATTREGTSITKRGRARGAAGRAMRAAGVTGPRLMPESIIELSSTPAETVRLLRAYGYITT